MLKDVTVVLTAVAMMVATLYYCWLTFTRRIRPAAAHWFVLNAAICLAFWTYWNAPEHSIRGNIGNFVGVFSTNLNFFAALWARWRDNELKYEFTSFQKQSLALAVGIVVLWYVLRYVVGSGPAAITANVLTQVLMVVGYIMLIQRLLSTATHSESLLVWAGICASTIFAVVPAIIETDWLGLLYAARGTVTSAPVVWIIARPESARRAFVRFGIWFAGFRTSLAKLIP